MFDFVVDEFCLIVEIECFKVDFLKICELYCEVCVLLFFCFGIMLMVNCLYQFVCKGSMSMLMVVLVEFWVELWEKSCVCIEYLDLLVDLQVVVGELVVVLWNWLSIDVVVVFDLLCVEVEVQWVVV